MRFDGDTNTWIENLVVLGNLPLGDLDTFDNRPQTMDYHSSVGRFLISYTLGTDQLLLLYRVKTLTP